MKSRFICSNITVLDKDSICVTSKDFSNFSVLFKIRRNMSLLDVYRATTNRIENIPPIRIPRYYDMKKYYVKEALEIPENYYTDFRTQKALLTEILGRRYR